MIKRTLIIFFFLCSTAFAAPTLSSYSSNTLTGSDLGAHADNGGSEDYLNFKWHDFDDATFGSYVTGSVSLTTSGQRTGSTYCAARDHNFSGTGDDGIGVSSSSTNDGYFTSFWAKRISGTTTDSDAQTKMIRISQGAYPNVTHFNLDFDGEKNTGVTIEDVSDTGYYPRDIASTFWNDYEWHNIMFWFKPSADLSGSDGVVTTWYDGQQYRNDTDVFTSSNGSNTYDATWNVCEYYHGYSDDFLIDDVYFDYTQARVVIGNASTLSACTHLEMQVPTAWSTTEITIDGLNMGSFTASDTIYMFVVDSSGVPSDGLLIQSGETPEVGTVSLTGSITLQGDLTI